MELFEQINEGKASILVAKEKKISRELPVFYNSEMKLNRDFSILLLNCIDKSNLRIADILAGTGVRSIRLAKELKKSKFSEILANDSNKTAFEIIKKNLKLNKIGKIVAPSNMDANQFLLENKMFDYIDIDPFGSPNPFLDASIKRLKNSGILAVTATDSAALCGTSPKACLRKYWAIPLYSEMMKETGIRILIRKVQLIGAQYEKALIPVFSHVTKHYFRIYFVCKTGANIVDQMLSLHKLLIHCSSCKNFDISYLKEKSCTNYKIHSKQEIGPLWTGELWDKNLVKQMQKEFNISPAKEDKEAKKLLEIISRESNYEGIGFYDIYELCSIIKVNLPNKQELIEKIRSKGNKAFETHFSYRGIKSDISLEELKKTIGETKTF